MPKGKKPRLNAQRALKKLEAALKPITGLAKQKFQSVSSSAIPGKLYELFVLSQVIVDLQKRGWIVSFTGTDLKFKASPGKIKHSDPHFELSTLGSAPLFAIYTDIEVTTLGKLLAQQRGYNLKDLSSYHEIDIVAVESSFKSGLPGPDDIALGVECKAHAVFVKAHVREVLGRRRELSFLNDPQPAKLALNAPVHVSAHPPSEFWLAHLDPAGTNYKGSPTIFSVELRHYCP